MSDVRKDVEDIKKMHATGEATLMAAFSINNSIISIFEQKLKKDFPNLSKSELVKKIHEELFYGRTDNP